MTSVDVDTAQGRAAAHLYLAERPEAALILGHGAGGGVAAGDLVAARDAALAEGVSVALVEQPYRVAGRRSPPPAHRLDDAWTTAVEHLRADAFDELPVARGRAFAGCPRGMPHRRGHGCRGRALPRVSPAAATPRLGILVAEQVARARRGDSPDARCPGRPGPVRHPAGDSAPHGGRSGRGPQPADGPGRRGGGCVRVASRRPRSSPNLSSRRLLSPRARGGPLVGAFSQSSQHNEGDAAWPRWAARGGVLGPRPYLCRYERFLRPCLEPPIAPSRRDIILLGALSGPAVPRLATAAIR